MKIHKIIEMVKSCLSLRYLEADVPDKIGDPFEC